MYTPDNREYIPVYHPNLCPEQTQPLTQSPEERISNFQEVSLGYTLDQAMEEASRCLKCPARYCAASCPAHVPVPEFVSLIRAGELEQAYQLISRFNTLPGMTGRVCPQECQCEKNCTRAIKGESVAIGRLEAFVADWHRSHAISKAPEPGTSAGRVSVVGSGPAGLACAEVLARAGVRVTVLEAENNLGGVPAYGIPGFSLPGSILEQKLDELRALGVSFQTGRTISSANALLAEGYDAVFLGTGAGRPVKTGLEGETLCGVLTARDYLIAIREGRQFPAGQSVAVIGGGNTAMDAARSALRLGASQVQIVYRRSQADMPASRKELNYALEEGVQLIERAAPVRFVGENGAVSAVECVRTEPYGPPLVRPDYRQISGSEHLVPAQLVILAVGFQVEGLDDVEPVEGRIQTSRDGVASIPGVYAAGDAVTGPSTLARAMAGGRQAAQSILRQLNKPGEHS